ncbi:MAG: L,D-transpeptidase [Anaerolineales bacterium]
MTGRGNSQVEADRVAALGREALAQGDRLAARRHAFRALEIDPQSEFGWLLLAALAPAQARKRYLERVLEINPRSAPAREGLAELSLRADRRNGAIHPAGQPAAAAQPIVPAHQKPRPRRAGQAAWRWARGILISSAAVSCVAVGVAALFAHGVGAAQDPIVFANLQKDPGTVTPTFTATYTPTVTPSFTPRPTPTFTASATRRPQPTRTQAPAAAYPQPAAAASSSAGTRWIDVDLSTQTVVAYQGNSPVATFLVSTGVPAHPTVTGRYRIYVKYRYDDMAGPDYYLPNVPYVMYFYEGYSLHGTYWHHNFGHPMSHGCVNMRTSDAAWLYNWASVGTLVNIHY